MLALLGLLLAGCNTDTSTGYNFACGSEMKQSEMKEFEAVTKPGYDMNALKLLSKLSLAIFDATGRTKNYNVQFFENTRNRLAVQVYGMWELVDMDKASCAVFNFADYQMPPETVVIFYQNEKNDPKQHVVLGLRKKP